jgi:hypothetical protein
MRQKSYKSIIPIIKELEKTKRKPQRLPLYIRPDDQIEYEKKEKEKEGSTIINYNIESFNV